MKNTKKKATKARAAVKRPKNTAKAPKGVRAKAAQRTAQGKFTKIIFNQIGGKECRRFAAMTWKERDAYMSKPENAAECEHHGGKQDSPRRPQSRHSVGTRPTVRVLVSRGKDVKTIQGLLRHAKVTTTLDLYSQSIDAAKLEAQEDIALAIRSSAAAAD